MLAARRAVIRFASQCTVSAPGRVRETLRQQIRGDTTFPLCCDLVSSQSIQ